MQTVNGWLRSLPAGTTDASLGETVLAALGESRDGTPHVTRDEINQRLAGLLRATGTRSYTAYAKGVRSVGVLLDDHQIVLSPTKNEGARGGFSFLDEEMVVAADAGPRALGEAVRVAFDACVPGTRDARPQPPGNAVGFGYKMRWLAVRDSDVGAVAAALGLRDLVSTGWADAVRTAYGDGWMITPPIRSWTLAASSAMVVPQEKREFVRWLSGLSSKLGEVHYFGTAPRGRLSRVGIG